MEIVGTPQPEKKSGGKLKSAFSKRRKVMILAGMFVLLIVTGYLNFAMNNQSPPPVGGGTQTNMFNVFRQNRSDERASQIAILTAMATNDSGFTEAERTDAGRQKLELMDIINFETTAEGLIMQEGFQDVVVNKNQGNINVLIRNPENITQQEANKVKMILDTVMQATIDIDNIFISVIR